MATKTFEDGTGSVTVTVEGLAVTVEQITKLLAVAEPLVPDTDTQLQTTLAREAEKVLEQKPGTLYVSLSRRGTEGLHATARIHQMPAAKDAENES